MMQFGKCTLNRRYGGRIELTQYIDMKGDVPENFREYLDVHKRALGSWDRKTGRYTGGRLIGKTREYTIVFLEKIKAFVKWRKGQSLKDFPGNVFVGYPKKENKKWIVDIFEPDHELKVRIRNRWDSKSKRFRNSVFLKRVGSTVIVYLEDLKICVGWKQKNKPMQSDRNTYHELHHTSPSYVLHSPGKELRRKIANSYGCG